VNRETLPVGEANKQNGCQHDDENGQSDEKSDLLLVGRRLPLLRHDFML
jgi:hypothetical protein